MGLLGLTRVGSRRVVQISAGFMIFFSTLGPPFFFSLEPASCIFSSCFRSYCINYLMWYSVLAGKFGALFASIPFPIFAALYCVLFGLVGKDVIHFNRIVHVMLFSFLSLICFFVIFPPCSICWDLISPVHKCELNAQSHHYWTLAFPWNICPPVFQWHFHYFGPWSRKYTCRLG